MTYSQTYTLNITDTADRFGSGLLPVYATPAMIALMENTATKAILDLTDNLTTVGIEINAQHLKASLVGENLTCNARLTSHTGKIYEFYIEVLNSNQEKIGTATHKRAAVNKTDFMERLKK